MVFRSKKGDMSIELIIRVTVAILILVILAGAAYRYIISPLSKTTSCPDQGGTCVDSLAGCEDGSDVQYQLRCTGSQKCCLPRELKPDETARFSTDQRQAIANPIFLTIGKNPQPVTSVSLKEGESIDMSIKFNDKLPTSSFGPIVTYLSSSQHPGTIYGIVDGAVEEISLPNAIGNGQAKPGDSFDFNWKPSLKDTYDTYTMNVIVLDKMKMACKPEKEKSDQAYLDCLNGKGTSAQLAVGTPTFDFNTLSAAIADRSYWLAGKSYPVKVQRILDITGVGTQWQADDTISIIANDPSYSKVVEIGIINAYDKTFDDVIDECVSGNGVHFIGKVSNVVGTTLDTSGIPLNINIGGFRVPTSKTELKYITAEKQIAMANGKADVKIDKATMIKDFYPAYENDPNVDTLMSGQNTFICARASPDGTTWAHAVSTTPLKVDVLPPQVDSDSVRISYPDVTFNTPILQQQYPSMAGQNYFYKQYPRVLIGCNDYGQSGCANYDYYLKTDNFINIQAVGTDTKDIITAVALQAGLNQLFQYLVSKDPLDTFCPPVFSTSEYRRNTQNVIPLRVTGQGMICIRVSDKVGNAVVVWKQIWNPQELVDKVASEAETVVAGAAG